MNHTQILNFCPSPKPAVMTAETTIIYLRRSYNMRQSRPYHKVGQVNASSAEGATYVGKDFVEAVAEQRYHGQEEYAFDVLFIFPKGTTTDHDLVNALCQRDPDSWKHHFQRRGRDAGQNEEELTYLKGEWTQATTQKLIDDVVAIINPNTSPKQEVKLRATQRGVNALLDHALANHDRVLLESFGGFGKTFLSLRNAAMHFDPKLDDYSLCLTPVRDNMVDFFDDASKYSYGDREVSVRYIKELTSKRMAEWIVECKATKKVPLILITVQDARGDTYEEDDDVPDDVKVKKLKSMYSFLFEHRLSMKIRDEIHLQHAAEVTYETLDVLKARKTLDMTATLTGREAKLFGYPEEAIISFGLVAALLERTKGDADMMALPQLKLKVVAGLDNHGNQMLGAEANITGGGIFAADKSGLLFPQKVTNLLAMTFTLGTYADTEPWEQAVCGHRAQTGVFMLKIPRGDSEMSASAKCEAVAKLGNKSFSNDAYFISAYELQRMSRANGKAVTARKLRYVIADVLRDSCIGGKKLIIVTHGVLLTGVNMPQLEAIALWDKIGSQALFMQLWYRLFRSWDNKTIATMVCYEPGITVTDSSAAKAIGALVNDAGKKYGPAVRRDLETALALRVYTGTSWHDLSTDELDAAYEANLRDAEARMFKNTAMKTIMALGQEGLDLIGECDVVGQGTIKGAASSTSITAPNGGKTWKPGQKKPADQKDEKPSLKLQLQVLLSMADQLHLMSVHSGKPTLNSIEVASSQLVAERWGQVNQTLLLTALTVSTYKEFADGILKVMLGDKIDQSLDSLLSEFTGAIGPSKPEEAHGQSSDVLDNLKLTCRLLNRETQRALLKAKTVLVVNPKSGLLVAEILKINPSIEIHVLAIDAAHDAAIEALAELHLTSIQVHRWNGHDTMLNMDFDFVIGNPPYKAGMHLEFLEVGLRHLKADGRFVFVHPAEWLVQKRNTPKSRKYKVLRDELMARGRTEITFIDNPWPTDAMLFVPLSITSIKPGSGCSFEDTRTSGYRGMARKPLPLIELESLDDVTQFGNPKHVNTLLEKIWSHADNWGDKGGVLNGPHFVNLARLAGDGFTDLEYLDGVRRKMFNMYSLVNSIGCTITDEPGVAAARGGKEIGNERVWVSFKTRDEAQNALDFLTKTKFFRAFIALIKIDQNAANNLLRFVPWLDWTKQWDDEALNSFFNFSTEEVATINEIVELITVR